MAEKISTNINYTGDRSPDLVIIGGGITGLSAAYMAASAGKKVTIIEAGNSFGGLLSTFKIAGNRLEYYYHHFFTHDRELHWLISELGLKERLFYRKTTMGVYRQGKIYPFNSPGDLMRFKPVGPLGKIRFGLTSLYLAKLANWKNNEDVPCINWLRKWAGKRTTTSLWAPLLKIKFGPHASEVPLSWMIGRMRQRMNSRRSGDERLGYIEGSLQLLLDTLLDKLAQMNVELVPNTPVNKINFENNRVTSVTTPQKSLEGKDFLFTIPGTSLSRLLEKAHPQLAQRLSRIRYFGAVCVVLELTRSLSDNYWLNIADEDIPFGGIIEHTNFVAENEYNGSHIAYLSRYFAGEEEIACMTEKEIMEMMVEYLPEIYPGFDKSIIKNSFVFRTNTAATVCDLGFSAKVPDCKSEVSNLYIANMSHVYPDERSTNNSIKIAAEALKCIGIPTKIPKKTNSLSGKIGF